MFSRRGLAASKPNGTLAAPYLQACQHMILKTIHIPLEPHAQPSSLANSVHAFRFFEILSPHTANQYRCQPATWPSTLTWLAHQQRLFQAGRHQWQSQWQPPHQPHNGDQHLHTASAPSAVIHCSQIEAVLCPLRCPCLQHRRCHSRGRES